MSEFSEMNGVFAINKPKGITSSQFLSKIQYIFTNSKNFSKELAQLRGAKIEQIQKEGGKASRRKLRKVEKVKMGHGGTLDPLATGVLVVGVGKGTKLLQNYLNGSVKIYETEALFGSETTTGDIEGEVLIKSGFNHITQSDIDLIPSKFIGDIKQTPPIFSALKLNGKPLYEYARNNIPLPKQLEPRNVKVFELEIFKDTLSKDHNYGDNDDIVKNKIDDEMIKNLQNNPTLNEEFHKIYLSKQYCEQKNLSPNDKVDPGTPIDQDDSTTSSLPPLLHFKTKVSSGTYIRSLISDIGKSLRSNAYMVKLIRVKQAEWELGQNVFELRDFEDRDERVWGKVLKQVLNTEKGEDIKDLNKIFETTEDEFKDIIQQEKEQKLQEKAKQEHAQQEQQEQREQNHEDKVEAKIDQETQSFNGIHNEHKRKIDEV